MHQKAQNNSAIAYGGGFRVRSDDLENDLEEFSEEDKNE